MMRILTQTEALCLAKIAVGKLLRQYPQARLPETCTYVAIGRGGLAALALVARFVPVTEVVFLPINRTLDSCLGDTREYLHDRLMSLQSRRTLVLVDDIFDTGETIEAVTQLVARTSWTANATVTRLVLLSKEARLIDDNFFYGMLIPEHQHCDWIVFPWEGMDDERRLDA